MGALRDELQAAGPVPDVPSIALTALGIDPGMRLMMRKRTLLDLGARKRDLYEALAKSVTCGDHRVLEHRVLEHRVLEHARHSTIQVDAPDEIVEAIRDLLVVVHG